jgi:hypothetical protein
MSAETPGTVWVIYEPARTAECVCWRDTVCPHGWTWQEVDHDVCEHREGVFDAYLSVADALRALYQVHGTPLGLLLKQRHNGRTWRIFVLRRQSVRPEDDHDVQPQNDRQTDYIVERMEVKARGSERAVADMYRGYAERLRAS